MNTRQRIQAYGKQTGTFWYSMRLTARQHRRLNKKARREFKDYRQRWATDTNAYPEWAGTERNEF